MVMRFARSKPRPGAKDVAGVVAKVVGEGVLGLGGEGEPVHEEENAGDRPGLEEALDEGGGGVGLAGSGRHFDEELPAPACDLVREGLDAIDLVAAINDPPVDGDIGERAADRPGRDPAFEVFLRVEGRDRARVGVRVPVEEPHLVAVREEDERDLELLRVVAPLVLGGERVDARTLRLDHRHRPPGTVAEHVIRPRAVAERVLEHHARPIGQVPFRVREKGVNLDPRERFGGAGHGWARLRRQPYRFGATGRGLPTRVSRPRIWQQPRRNVRCDGRWVSSDSQYAAFSGLRSWQTERQPAPGQGGCPARTTLSYKPRVGVDRSHVVMGDDEFPMPFGHPLTDGTVRHHLTSSPWPLTLGA